MDGDLSILSVKGVLFEIGQAAEGSYWVLKNGEVYVVLMHDKCHNGMVCPFAFGTM